jgi:hypothetical protein
LPTKNKAGNHHARFPDTGNRGCAATGVLRVAAITRQRATPKVGDQPPRRPEKIFPAGGDRLNPFAAKSRGWLLRARQSYSHPLNLRAK